MQTKLDDRIRGVKWNSSLVAQWMNTGKLRAVAVVA